MAGKTPLNIGRYTVESELGKGGFGCVYKALDSTMGRRVAIKILTALDDDGVSRFRAEATATARLNHPNIVTIYEYGMTDNTPFLAMEYLEGQDLQQIIASPPPLSLLEKVRIMTEVAKGLQHAHENGVIHRDVKPSNIRVLPNGDVKVMDFGIARLVREESSRLTQQGFLIGTILYMAPEQFSGQDADAQCDIFAYGLIFYQLLAGKHPFQAADTRSIMYKMTMEEPPLLSPAVPDCPLPLERIIMRALQRDRNLRYQSVADLLPELRSVLLDLQKLRAKELVEEAQDLLKSEKKVEAQSVVRSVLELDPANPEARKMFHEIQQSMAQMAAQSQIQAILKAAEDLVKKGSYQEAMAILERATASFPQTGEIARRVEELRDLREKESARARKRLPNEETGGSNADCTMLVDSKTTDLPPPAKDPGAEPPHEFTRYFGRTELDEPLSAFLTIVSCPDSYREGQTIAVRSPRFSIGRSQCDLSLPEDKTLSRSHAFVLWNGTGFAIQDAGARNGTYVNGRRLQSGAEEPLPLNAEIRLSTSTRLRFRCDISELPDFTGQKLVDRYTLEKCLRAGRKSAIYEGSDNRPVRKVAVKLLSPTLASYPGYLEQFQREAQTAAELNHPNICRIYEHGRAPLAFRPGDTKQVHYLCMQMLEGGSLAERLDSPEHITPAAVAEWLDIVADALKDAHRSGVVHAGLKPTSVVFSSAGVPYLTDFAIATRSKDAARSQPLFGAPEYLAPEQWDGLAPAPQSDQYSLACLCYRVLTGSVPFENQLDPVTRGTNFGQGAPAAHMRARVQGRLPFPEAISSVLATALSVVPAKRFPTIGEFAQAFRRSLGESPARKRKPSVFVSYRREADAGWAALFADKLSTQHGLDVFVDRHRVDSARQVPEKIETAIRDCDFFVCLLARTTLESAWVREEIRIADAAGKPMIPVIQEGFRRPVGWKLPAWLKWLVPRAWQVPECAKRLMDAEEVRLFADYDQSAIEKLAAMVLSGIRKS